VYRRRGDFPGVCWQVTRRGTTGGIAFMRKIVKILAILVLAAGGFGIFTSGPAFAYVCGPVCANHHCCPPP
jgi:hypothetical protein